MTLCELELNVCAHIEKLLPSQHGLGLVSRLEAMGFLPGRSVRVVRKSKLGPMEVRVGSTTQIAIRTCDAACVIVQTA
jgi:ferrous iron transport protein A